MKKFYILSGANGSGKSTISKVLLPTEEIDYVNPDDIAKNLSPQDPLSVRIEAGREALRRIESLMEKGLSFAVESTLSGRYHLSLLARARELGYDTTVGYVFVDNAEICVERIKVRVKNGGHNVPAADVQRRYKRSKINFWNDYRMAADHWALYYNGGVDLVLVAHGNGSTNVLSQDRFELFKEDFECQN